MKELATKTSEPIEYVKQVNVKKKKQLIEKILPHNGHTLFEYDKAKCTITKAKFRDVPFNMATNSPSNKEVDVKPGCFYTSNLNSKSAIKKLMKLFKPKFIIELP